jgi:ABC-type sulfate/molybdate transport systems ATPase subunit
MPTLEVSLQKRLASFQLNVSFTADKELVVLFGPSGSGKSLTLQAIAGTVQPDAGGVVLDGQPLYDSRRGHNLPPQQRRVGYVPQHYALFPHLTVADNIAFGLRHVSRRLRVRRVAELLELFGMQGFERRLPRQLSGGQQQRVALARSLAVQPRLLLLDEPFTALDDVLRDTLRQELAQVQARWDITVLLVTHDLADVFALAQGVVVYDGGQVIQQGRRDDVFFRPQNRRVAEFVRTGNILPAVVERADAETLWLRWQGYTIAAAPQPLAPGTPVYLCIRPAQVLIVRPERFAARRRDNLLCGEIVRETMHAETYTLYLRLENSQADYDLEVTVPSYVYHRLGLDTKKRLTVELSRQALHVIHPGETPAPTLPLCSSCPSRQP